MVVKILLVQAGLKLNDEQLAEYKEVFMLFDKGKQRKNKQLVFRNVKKKNFKSFYTYALIDLKKYISDYER